VTQVVFEEKIVEMPTLFDKQYLHVVNLVSVSKLNKV
jgi:hypothetical protein